MTVQRAYIEQSGRITPGHLAIWTTTGVVQDGGVPTPPAGATLGVPQIITANYTLFPSDSQTTLQLGTGSTGAFTVTAPATTGFGTNFIVRLFNADTTAIKTVTGTGVGLPLTLLPQHSIDLQVINGAWRVTRPSAAVPTTTVDIKDFGAVGDNMTDDTTAIEAFFTYCSTNGAAGYVSPGTYLYTGTGHPWLGTSMFLYGAGAAISIFHITSSAYLIDTAVAKIASNFEKIQTTGGLGAFRSTFAGSNVSYHKVFRDNQFLNYTQCAIQANGLDEPYWYIIGNIFYAANSTSTIGVALGNGPDASHIQDNSFLLNRIHVKGRSGHHSTFITNNDFLFFDAGNVSFPRAFIWSVPDVTGGSGLKIITNRMGNENLQTFDTRVLYADEVAGTWNGDRMPDLATDSTGIITYHSIRDNRVAGAGVGQPFIYSTTPNIQACDFSNNVFDGSLPTSILAFLTAPIGDVTSTTNLLGPQIGFNSVFTFGFPLVSNGYGMGMAPDPNGIYEFDAGNFHCWTGGGQDYCGYVQILSSAVSGMLFAGGAVLLGPATDASGGTDAALYSLPDKNTALVYNSLTIANITVGAPAWVEFDLQQGPANPLTVCEVVIEHDGGGGLQFERWVNVPPNGVWQRFRFPVILRENATLESLVFLNPYIGTTKQIYIGRVRVYHAREPIAFGRSTFEHINASLLPTSSAGLNAGSVWVDTSAGNVLKRV